MLHLGGQYGCMLIHILLTPWLLYVTSNRQSHPCLCHAFIGTVNSVINAMNQTTFVLLVSLLSEATFPAKGEARYRVG